MILMGSVQKFIRERKADKLGDRARDLKYSHRFAEAAELYTEQAAIALEDNELIAADDYEDAFEMWMKAGDFANAMSSARASLHCYTPSDWLKGENPYIEDLLKMVNDLHKADRVDDADQFLTNINDYLKTIDEEPVSITVLGSEHKFPIKCPECGGAITYHGVKWETNCPYCNCLIQALA